MKNFILALCLAIISIGCATTKDARFMSVKASVETSSKVMGQLTQLMGFMFPGATYFQVEDWVATYDGSLAIVSVMARDNVKKLYGTLYIEFVCGSINKNYVCKILRVYRSYPKESAIELEVR